MIVNLQVIFIGLFILFIALLGEFMKKFVPCSVRNVFKLKENVWVYYGSFLVFIYITVVEGLAKNDAVQQQLIHTVLIFVLFVFITHMHLYPMLAFLVMFYIIYRYYIRITDDLDKNKMNEEQHRRYTLFLKAAVFVIGLLFFLEYVGGKSREYGSRFTWGKFFGPQMKCQGTPSRFQLQNIPRGFSRLFAF